MSEITDLYGAEIVITNCVLGSNLNLGVIRGFARLDMLAAISAPDIFDKIANPHGTQRDLKAKHAKEATNYAMESLVVPAETEPRAFTEVILNARDRSAVSIIDPEDNSSEMDFASTDSLNADPQVVTLKVHLNNISWPHPKEAPQISRVDGNHRLSQVILPAADEMGDYPVIPFALFVGLTTDQERAIFRDINGTQEKMETAHLDHIKYRLHGAELLKTEGGRALWLAQQLAEQDHAFHGKVHFGGSKKGAKAATGAVPPITISALKGAVAATMKDMPAVEAEFFGMGPDQDEDAYAKGAQKALLLLDRFWKSAAKAYDTAWQDRSKYILLQSIGLTAFSKLGADIIKRQFLEEGDISVDAFDKVLEHVASEVSLERENFPGLAGLAGAREVYKKLSLALNSQAIAVSAAKKELDKAVSDSSPLDD